MEEFNWSAVGWEFGEPDNRLLNAAREVEGKVVWIIQLAKKILTPQRLETIMEV